MKVPWRSKQAAAAAVGGAVALVGAAASLTGRWSLAGACAFVVLGLLLVLTAHTHKRAGDAVNGLRRQRTVLRRTAARAVANPGPTADDVLATVDRHGVLLQTLVTARLDEVERSLTDITGGLRTAAARLERGATGPAAADPRLDELAELLARLERRARVDHEEVRKLLGRLRHEPVTEIDALLQLHRRFPLEGSVPLTWGWALSPRGLLQVVEAALTEHPTTIVECGSGTSTLFLAAALRDRPSRLVSLEHDESFAETTRGHLRDHGLDQRVEIRTAPLTDVELGDATYRWYDPDATTGLAEVGLLVVDGPPGRLGPMARYPAVPLLADALAPGATVILDDASRPSERAVLARWLEDHPLERRWSTTLDQAVLRWQGERADQA